jgi:hypothetical protein
MGKELREYARRKISATGMIYATDGKAIVSCSVRNVSAGGAQLILDREKELPPKFVLSMSQTGQVRRECTLVWQFSIMAGTRFNM